jgi:hypothetical protein
VEEIRFAAMVERGDLRKNYVLKDGDIVYVDERGASKFNYYLSKLLPSMDVVDFSIRTAESFGVMAGSAQKALGPGRFRNPHPIAMQHRPARTQIQPAGKRPQAVSPARRAGPPRAADSRRRRIAGRRAGPAASGWPAARPTPPRACWRLIPGKEPTLTGRERETIPGNLGDYTRTLLSRLTAGDVLLSRAGAVPATSGRRSSDPPARPRPTSDGCSRRSKPRRSRAPT